jgi:hypothetical protein
MKLSELERKYFVQKSGGAEPTEPLNNIRRRYMQSLVGADANTPFNELEAMWLVHVINDNSGTVTNSRSNATLWKDAVIAIGETPSTYITENQKIFYTNDI